MRGATEREAAQAVERAVEANPLEADEKDNGRTIRITRAGRNVLVLDLLGQVAGHLRVRDPRRSRPRVEH